MQTITPARSYRAYLIPRNIEDDDVEAHHARGMLTPLRVKAIDAEDAARRAHQVSGLRVHSAERVEEVAA